MLEALLLATPAFLRAEDLLEQVWDEQADPFTNTVAVTIGRLRRKLGNPPVITTTPNVGYRLLWAAPRSLKFHHRWLTDAGNWHEPFAWVALSIR